MIIRLWLIALVSFLGLVQDAALAQDDYEIGQAFQQTLRSGCEGPRMMVIPGGRFVLGGGPVSSDNIGLIKIEYQLAVGIHEVTRGQYRCFLEQTRSGSLGDVPAGGDDLPMTNVSWDDAEAYVSWLSREAGNYYRLPSAAEWEYAARAGTSSNYFWGEEAGEGNANCLNCQAARDARLVEVGSFPANKWGLHDMHGNVWEWTKDCIDPNSAPPPDGSPQLFGNCDTRELRGGSAESDAWSVRSGARAFAQRKVSSDDVGFRVVMDLP
jgi:formylglycine-generating enzyme required for sulfatase activity